MEENKRLAFIDKCEGFLHFYRELQTLQKEKEKYPISADLLSDEIERTIIEMSYSLNCTAKRLRGMLIADPYLEKSTGEELAFCLEKALLISGLLIKGLKE